MTSKAKKVVLVWAMLLGLVATEAGAWGPAAQTAITNVAIQRIQRKYPVVFQNEEQKHHNDVLKGAVDACYTLDSNLGIKSRQDALDTVNNHIILLREMRQYGIGSYFAYRMGVLSAVVADLLLPFALESSPEDAAIRAQLEKDIEANVKKITLLPSGDLVAIRDIKRYFSTIRPFSADALRMIRADYTSGTGYEGYMKNAAASFFDDAARAVSDVWFTILNTASDSGFSKPSNEAMTWYAVNDIQYQLTVKNNPAEALKKYAVLEKVNTGIADAYERVGDLLDTYGAQAGDAQLRERAVKEWQRALDMPGVDRRRVSSKIGEYYISTGRALMADVDKPGGYKKLPDAITSFAKALEFDRENTSAKTLHTQAQKKKREIDQEFEAQSRKIDTAEQVKKRAEESKSIRDFTNAILVYDQAYGYFDSVTDQFPELKDSADKQKDAIRKAISEIKNDVLTEADDTIARGDEAVQAKNFDEAINQYQSVESIVKVINDGPETDFGKQRDEKIAKAAQKVTEAENAKSRWQAEQEALKNNPQGGAR